MKFWVFILTLLPLPSFAHEAGETQAQIGPGKAIEAFDEHEGLKLSESARKTINVETKKIASPAVVPPGAILSIQDKKAVFIFRNGWFKMLYVGSRINGNNVEIKSQEIETGDEVVIRGVALLRVAYMNVSDGGKEHGEETEHHEHDEKHEDHHD